MSAPLSSLRGHFFKHLAACASAASFFAFRRGISRRFERDGFHVVYSAKARQQPPWKRTPAAGYSSRPLIDDIATSDAFASPYLSVRIRCSRNSAEAFSECLMCFGASSVTIGGLDGHDNDEEIWISSIFKVDQDVKDCVSKAADSAGFEEIPCFEVEMLDHTDWIRKTQDSFHPVKITEGLWIVPEWKKPPDPEAINIILNPGLAFGTGEHPTTKLCLLELHKLIKGGERFLDYGTGSGVLAIAALKLGAARSVAFDIEPQAITAARSNAALNIIGEKELLATLVPSSQFDFDSELPSSIVALYDPELIEEKNLYDVVIANILLHPLLELADQIISYAKIGATVCVSGLLFEQVPSVIRRYSPLLENISVSTIDDWACIRGMKITEQKL